MTTSHHIPALVTDLWAGGLAAARTLGRRGIPVIGLSNGAPAPGVRSRHVWRIWNYRGDSDALVDVLLRRRGELNDSPVVFATNDLVASALSRRRDELLKGFRLPLPAPGVIEEGIGKQGFARLADRLGLPIPRTFQANDLGQMECVARQTSYPCILKPDYRSVQYFLAARAKAFIAENAAGLLASYRKFCHVEPRVVVQEWIPGRDEELCFCLQYYGLPGRPLVSFCGRKIRQWPPRCGSSSSCQPVECPQAEQLTTRFFSAIGFRGFGSMEFKRNPADGRLLLIEPTIGRMDLQIGLADLNGVPISYLAYCDLAGLPLPALGATQKRVKWVEFRADRRAARRHVAKGELTWLDWLWSIRPPVGWAVWSMDDPGPWLADVFGRLGRRAGRRLGLSPRKRPPALVARWKNSSAAKPIETIRGGAVGIVQATSEDVDCILGILSQAGQWLLAKGIRQWPTPPPRKWVVKRVERGEFFLARVQAKAIGTFRLNWSDEEGLWGNPPVKAGYLGKLAILRTVAGKGVGLELLQAAERMAASAGRVLLRLDCWSGNAFLCDYYAQAGFQKCGTGSRGDSSVCLFEKKLG